MSDLSTHQQIWIITDYEWLFLKVREEFHAITSTSSSLSSEWLQYKDAILQIAGEESDLKDIVDEIENEYNEGSVCLYCIGHVFHLPLHLIANWYIVMIYVASCIVYSAKCDHYGEEE